MPLYTYVMTHRARTVVHQERRGNYRGWIDQAIGSAFPDLKLQSTTQFSQPLEPITNSTHVWRGRAIVPDGEIDIVVVEKKP